MAKVYFMNDRAQSTQTSLVAKMLTLFDAAGFDKMIKRGDTVAIKLHMGEYNNTSYLRPVYVRALADKVKSLGGDPMVVDTTTLTYLPFASRASATDYLKTAARNGFTSETVGCPIIIADGYIGTDDMKIDLPEGFILKEQYVATGIALADSMIALTHFKGHPMGTYGGAIKNIGVGCASKRGKLNLHMGQHPKYGLNTRSFVTQRCMGKDCPVYEVCKNVCPEGAFHHTDTTIEYYREKCTGCLACLPLVSMACGVGGLPEAYFDVTAAAIADSALAVSKALGPEKIAYINMAIDLSPGCDCVNYSDRAFVGDMGIFASWDPVAIDSACIQMTKDSAGVPNSIAMEKGVDAPGMPKLTSCGSAMGVSEEIQPNVGQKIGLGTREYELEEVPEQDDPSPFEFSDMPVGARFKKAFAKKGDIYPPGGFKYEDEVDLEDMR
ncbi:MAG: DUF362 domain-containing protein [Deltaproteobacteria bacterium]|nr:DUF362 domain-containing protein [Deltaproteobacteria bacterium]